MMRRYTYFGFDFAPHEVITNREAHLAHLQNAPHRRWGLMLDPGHGLAQLDYLDAIFLDGTLSGFDRARRFLLIGADGFDAG